MKTTVNPKIVIETSSSKLPIGAVAVYYTPTTDEARRKAAKRILRNMPPAVETEKTAEQRYQEWFDEQVKLGLDDIDAGRVISHEEVMRRSDAHLAALKRKYG